MFRPRTFPIFTLDDARRRRESLPRAFELELGTKIHFGDARSIAALHRHNARARLVRVAMLREIAKQVIPRSQWAATYVDTMPTMRHARGAARWGGVAVFGLFWMIGDPAFEWVANLGSSAEEEA